MRSIDLRNCYFAFLTLVLWCGPLHAIEWPRPSFEILKFNHDDTWEGMQTTLEPVAPAPLYRSKLVSRGHISDTCTDLLDSFQSRPLKVMLDNKYITLETYRILMGLKRLGVDPKTLILLQQYSEVDEAEAKEWFGGVIPDDRILKGAITPGKVRIYRGTLYAVLGYEIEMDAHGNLRLIHRPMPWELGDLPANLTQRLPQDRMLERVELGRAHVEAGILPGDFLAEMQVMISMLSADASVLGMAPEEFLVTAHFLKAGQARLFTHGLPFRFLTDEHRTQLESNRREFLSTYLSIPRPRGKEWKEEDDVVVFGSLAAFQEKFPPAAWSEYVQELRAAVPQLSPVQARDFLLEATAVHRQDYQIQGMRAPIMVRDYGTALYKIRLYKWLKDRDLITHMGELEKLLNVVEKYGLSTDPDFGSKEWLERGIQVPLEAGEGVARELVPLIVVNNLDATVPSQYREHYLASILLSLAHKYERELDSLDVGTSSQLLIELNKQRTQRGLRVLTHSELSFGTFLETNDLMFGTFSEELRRELLILGGSPRQGLSISNPFDAGFHPDTSVHIEGATEEEAIQQILEYFKKHMFSKMNEVMRLNTLAHFREADIEEARSEFPDLRHKDVLRPSHHKWRLRRHYISVH